MLHISPLNSDTQSNFSELFSQYYAEMGCDDNIPHLLDEYVIPDLLAGLLNIDILDVDGEIIGFVIWQTDDINNDWNFKEGWGDIREIYVSPSFRYNGYGKFMLYTAELKLKESGADKAYCLPSAASEEFFVKCGYVATDEVNADLDCRVFEKKNLNNCECKNGR